MSMYYQQSSEQRRREEQLQEQAAADAQRQYYQHPNLHAHHYMQQPPPIVDPASMGPKGPGAMNDPYRPPDGNGNLEENVIGPSVQDVQNSAAFYTGMQPYLQIMCGPLLNYYTIANGIWHGAVLVVTVDNGSVLQPEPFLNIAFHQADHRDVVVLQAGTVPSQRIYTYHDANVGPCSFWRFLIQVPVQSVEMIASYQVNGGASRNFFIPAIGQNLRWSAHSCNGFSGGVNPDEFRGSFESGYDPLWDDMLQKHSQQPFHCMVGGGDQIYCDPLTRERDMQSYITAPDRYSKLNHPLTDEIKACVDRFYFNHYCVHFRRGAFARANSTIPMVNMLDDHDLIDGFGSYDDETMSSPVFSFIGSRGYFWFLLFQLFCCDDFDGINFAFGQHPIKNILLGSPGAWIPSWSHSLSVYLGPKVHMILLDCRAERKLTRIVSGETYSKVFAVIESLPAEVEHVVMQLGVPIAYPRMAFLEHFLEFKYNPINILARHKALGLGGMANNFNHSAELLDDLNDHWCANTHKPERNWLVLEMQRLALKRRTRITFLSGDVHLAAVGCLFTHKGSIPSENDHRYMLNVISSAIVNTPPPAGAAGMVNKLGGHKHRTLHRDNTDENMIPLFNREPNGQARAAHYALNRRNWCSIDYKPQSGDLVFDIRVEREQGSGDTVGYAVIAPPPVWKPQDTHPRPYPLGR